MSDSGTISGKYMNLQKRISKHVNFARQIYKNRRLLQELLNSDNLRFIRYARPGHFYSPIPDFSEIVEKAGDIFERTADNILSIRLDRDLQIELLEGLAVFYNEMPFPEEKTEKSKYYLDNKWFSYGDGITLYSFIRYFRPKKVIEVGSGFSSAVMLETNKRFLGNRIDLVFIEPHPERLFGLLDSEGRDRCTVIEEEIQKVPIDLFLGLSENDFLFIDSSHVVKIGSDVLHIFANILPQLKNGVIVHFHDILWPFEYPRNWIENGKAWNEAYFIRAFLQYNEAFQVIYFNSFLENHYKELLEEKMPLVLRTPSSKGTPGNTSLWLRKRSK